MQHLSPEKIKNDLLQLAAIPSLSNTEGEKEIEKKLVEMLGDIEYFSSHPRRIYRHKLPDDKWGREVIAGLLSGKKRGKNDAGADDTVILLNHHDVVDVLDYGRYKEQAFSPLELTRLYQEEGIGEEGESGEIQLSEKMEKKKKADDRMNVKEKDYLYGRGVADMKAGIAIQLAVLEYFSTAELAGNILFVSVPDEETSSRGMLAAVDLIHEIKTEHDLNLRGVINCEPTFPAHPGDEGRYIYTGSMGKTVVFFYCRGLATHVGDVLSGLNGNLLMAEIIRELEGKLKYCDEIEGYTAPPPTCLKARDNKRYYSAQIPHTAGGYFNINLLNSTPREIISTMKGLARDALDEVMADLSDRRAAYLQEQNIECAGIVGEPEGGESGERGWIMSFSEFWQEAAEAAGPELERAVEELIAEKQGEIEEQELCLQIADRVNDFVEREEPGIVVGFTPPYYPPVVKEKSVNEAEADGENGEDEEDAEYNMKELAELLIGRAGEAGFKLDLFPAFPGISDLSYCSLTGELEDYQSALAENMPLWKRGYSLPLARMAELGLPVINISVEGRDAHKHTERLELNYSLKMVPELVRYACERILNSDVDDEMI